MSSSVTRLTKRTSNAASLDKVTTPSLFPIHLPPGSRGLGQRSFLPGQDQLDHATLASKRRQIPARNASEWACRTPFTRLRFLMLCRECEFRISCEKTRTRRASEWIHTHEIGRCRMRREIPTKQGDDPLAGASSWYWRNIKTRYRVGLSSPVHLLAFQAIKHANRRCATRQSRSHGARFATESLCPNRQASLTWQPGDQQSGTAGQGRVVLLIGCWLPGCRRSFGWDAISSCYFANRSSAAADMVRNPVCRVGSMSG